MLANFTEFKHDLVDIEFKLTQVNTEEGRYYIKEGVEDSPKYPSVTSVLSKRSEASIKRWRERVGEAEADRISQFASERGTLIHEMIENHIMGREQPNVMPQHFETFRRLRDIADEHIDNIRGVELQMASDHLRVAGTVDLVAEYNGRLSIIDWKTAKKPKQEKWIHNYFMQESAYAVMFEENTGIPVDQLVTCITCDTGDSQVFIQKRDDWIDKFIKERNEYFL